MKLSKARLKEMIQEAIRSQLNEMSKVDTRMSQLDRFKKGNDLSSYELLEDVLEQLDGGMWKVVLAGLKNKYGFLF